MTRDRTAQIIEAFSGQTFSSTEDAHAWLLRQCPPRIFASEEDEGWIATVPDLPGCTASGANYEEAQQKILTAMEAWIEAFTKKNVSSAPA